MAKIMSCRPGRLVKYWSIENTSTRWGEGITNDSRQTPRHGPALQQWSHWWKWDSQKRKKSSCTRLEHLNGKIYCKYLSLIFYNKLANLILIAAKVVWYLLGPSYTTGTNWYCIFLFYLKKRLGLQSERPSGNAIIAATVYSIFNQNLLANYLFENLSTHFSHIYNI